MNAGTGVRGYAVDGGTRSSWPPITRSMIRVGADRRALRVAAVNGGGGGPCSSGRPTPPWARCWSELRQIRSDVSSHAPAGHAPGRPGKRENHDGSAPRSDHRPVPGPGGHPGRPGAAGSTGWNAAIDWLTISGLALGLLAGLGGGALFTSGISRRIIAARGQRRPARSGTAAGPGARDHADEIGRLATRSPLRRRVARLSRRGADHGAGSGAAGDPGKDHVPVQDEPRAANPAQLHPRLRPAPGAVRAQQRKPRERASTFLARGATCSPSSTSVIDIARIESGRSACPSSRYAGSALIEETSQLMAAPRRGTLDHDHPGGESSLAVLRRPQTAFTDPREPDLQRR